MASYYVWSGATGTATGADWANAYLTLNGATGGTSGKAPGDTFYIAHDHVEATTGVIGVNGNATTYSKVICVDRAGSVPPVAADRRTTGQLTSTGTNNLAPIGAGVVFDGIIFRAGVGTSGSSNLFFGNGTGGQSMRFENCSFQLGITGSSASSVIFGSTSFSPQNYEMINTTLSCGSVLNTMQIFGTVKWRNTPSAIIGAAPTNLFVPQSNRGAILECVGVDFSAIGAGKTICNIAGAGGITFRFIDCKLDPAVTRAVTPTANRHGEGEIDFIRSGATGNYSVYSQRLEGVLTEELVFVRTPGGATDLTTPLSWKVATTAVAGSYASFECPPIAVWNDTVGSARTATVEGIWGVATPPLDSECWLELEHLASSSHLATIVSDGTPNLLTTPVAQTASSAVWPYQGPITWDPTTATAVTFPVNSLTPNSTGTTSADQGVRVATAAGKTSGKFYFECQRITAGGGNNMAFGVGTTDSTYTNMGNTATTGAMVRSTGVVWVNGSVSAVNLATISASVWTGCAIDLDNRKVWFKKAGGNWNGSATANPATNTEGLTLPAGTIVPFVTFGGTGGNINQQWGTNFGASAFNVGTAPTGFTAGWFASTAAQSAFKLSTTFTAQQKGWVYARVKCAKPSSTFYIDPKVTLT